MYLSECLTCGGPWWKRLGQRGDRRWPRLLKHLGHPAQGARLKLDFRDILLLLL